MDPNGDHPPMATQLRAGAGVPGIMPPVMERVLKVSLGAKLAGANLLIVLAAWAAYAAFHGSDADWRMLAVMTVALLVALVVNLVLVSIALRPIRDLEQTATRVWAGDLETRVPRSAIADASLSQVGGILNFLLNALSEDRARVRALAKEVVRTGDRERSRVGKELHDSIAQSLAALRYQLIAIEREAGNGEIADGIRAIRDSAGEVLEQVRLLSHTVHPQILDDLGLVAALRHLARTSAAGTTISVDVPKSAEPVLRSISSDVAVAVYRVVSEAVANSIRHGAPTTIKISVGMTGDDVILDVTDDGKGFDPALAERNLQAMGLFTMRERIALLNGTVEVTSARERGTSIRARVPAHSTRPVVPISRPIQTETQNAG
jgi:two-component system, NarL family, sensor histidine kinase UhpB